MQISIGEDINESGIVINNPLSLLQNPFIPVWSLSGCHALLYSCKDRWIAMVSGSRMLDLISLPRFSTLWNDRIVSNAHGFSILI